MNRPSAMLVHLRRSHGTKDGIDSMQIHGSESRARSAGADAVTTKKVINEESQMMSFQFHVTLLAAAVALVGCGKAQRIQTYPVTGTVTYNGKPLAGATVTYSSKEAGTSAATAVTDQDGQFSLTTYISSREVYKGAVPGSYSVTIVKPTAETQQAGADMANYASLSDKERADMMANAWQKQNDGGKREPTIPKPTSEIPLKYADSKTSGFVATVVIGENEPREFKLNDD